MRKSKTSNVNIKNLSRMAIDKLAACLDATRDLQNNYYSELKALLAHRRKTPATKEETAALLEIFKFGPRVMGGKVRFLRWMNYPSIALGRKTPLKLILSHKAEIVRDELGRIEYGVIS